MAEEVFKNDLTATCNKFTEGASELIFISIDAIKDEKHSLEDLEALQKTLGGKCPEAVKNAVALSIPGRVLDNYRKIGVSDGVILAVPYGKKCGSQAEHTITQLKKHGCRIVGVLLVRANQSFMKKYYRIK